MILTADYYKDNGGLIAAIHELGYIVDSDQVLDATYGSGVWWKQYRPPDLIENHDHFDFRHFPSEWRDLFDVVTFDPPYQLHGSSSRKNTAFEQRYGIGNNTPWEHVHEVIKQGIRGCEFVLKPGGYLIVKCMNQVARNHRRFQVIEFANYATGLGLTLEDELLFLHKPRMQDDRPQRHSRMNYSTALVFQKAA